MKKNKFNAQSGMSLIEVLIVLVVSIILTTFAFAQFGKSKVIFQRQNIVREFKVNLERARFDSVKRNAVDVNKRANIIVKANKTSFDVTTDLNQNGTLDTSDTRTIDFSGRSDVKIVPDTGVAGDTIVLPITIRFDNRGQITSEDSSSPKKSVTRFIFCSDGCTTATANQTNSSVVSVSLSGTVSMTAGGETLPTFSDPTITNAADYQINPDLLITKLSPTPVPTATSIPTATPVPTVTPKPTATPVPTATPTPKPTVTPVPTITPTPTPLPANACSYGAKPKATGCVCYANMYVNSSGKCVGIQ